MVKLNKNDDINKPEVLVNDSLGVTIPRWHNPNSVCVFQSQDQIQRLSGIMLMKMLYKLPMLY